MHPALRAIGYGDRLRDKAVIAAHVAAVAAFPVGIAARRIGRPIPDPRAKLGGYTVRGPAGVFACPASSKPYFVEVGHGYEPGMCRVVEQLEGGVFIDVGASVGFITARAARRAERVFAIEPHPVRFEYLKRNVEMNGLTNVTCFQCALGSRSEGSIVLYDLDPSLGPHRLDASTKPGAGERFDVPFRRVDDLVQGEVGLLNIDVKGRNWTSLPEPKSCSHRVRESSSSRRGTDAPRSPAPPSHLLVRRNRHRQLPGKPPGLVQRSRPVTLLGLRRQRQRSRQIEKLSRAVFVKV